MSHLYLYNTFELIHLVGWSLNLNALRSRFDVFKVTLSLISLWQLLKMLASYFLASNDFFPKYSRDIVISFFCVAVKFRTRSMNNLSKIL